jgi:uncharacterized 2Fe-2S/4Fe-4S cluster protein (DUF4445 family)
LPVHREEQERLTKAQLAEGWRLACRHTLYGDLHLELAQWEMPVLADESSFAFTAREGLGIAVDLGTTTIAAQLLDLESGSVLVSETALNSQALHGGDIMSRIEFAMHGGEIQLRTQVRRQIGDMVARCVESHSDRPLARVILVGNTAMHHLFCGIDVAPLSAHPFHPERPGRCTFSPAELGWAVPDEVLVEFLPCPGGFVGSDVLAGIVACGLAESDEVEALVDLGTNGEVVVGSRERLLCTSTAAGPAFEGARISMGMRAVTGAINAAEVQDGQLVCAVIGNGPPRGVCGSGLVDVVAAGLEMRQILSSGRMRVSPSMPLAGEVSLLPSDVRELQLAKGAIATGLRMLTSELGMSVENIQRLHLAGAFGNYIRRASAQRIGLLKGSLDRVVPAGNTALLGAKRALFEEPGTWDKLAGRIEHVSLGEDAAFQELFAEELGFPS